MIKKAILYGVMCVFLIGVVGCDMDSNKAGVNKETESTIVFTERQIEILEELNITDDYSRLSSAHLDIIEDIEAVLDYLESKYGKEFGYSNHLGQWGTSKKEYIVYEKDGSGKRTNFHVIREEVNGMYEYSDGYMEVYMKPIIKNYVSMYACSIIDERNMKIHCSVDGVDMAMPPNNDEIEGDVYANFIFFINGIEVNDETFVIFKDKIVEWQKKEHIYGRTQFVLMKEDVMDDISEDNYSEYLDEKYYYKRLYEQIKDLEGRL